MICSKCNTEITNGNVCPMCGESAEIPAEIELQSAEEITVADYTATKSTEAASNAAQKSPSVEEHTAFKRMLILDIVKLSIFIIYVILPVLTPAFDESLLEEFFEKIDRVFYNGIDPDPLVPVLLFLWGMSIIVRLAIRIVAQSKKLSSFDGFYLEKFKLKGDELYSAFTDGKSGIVDLILSIESILLVLITVFVYGVPVLVGLAMSALPALVLAAAIYLKLRVRRILT